MKLEKSKLYEMVRATGYIETLNLSRSMEEKSAKEYNITLVLSACPYEKDDLRVELKFNEVTDFKIGNINNFYKIFIEVSDMSDCQLEGIRYIAEDVEHGTIFVQCNEIQYKYIKI
ncbi:hypothetical protein [Acetatifactor aquisgranensis]|jgi:hypothetical protein|uniref:hypothetical protein n=1 Tax=Acetatifactor aquisgranensis TaxID=2941233 RepID=UPI00203A8A60|nr:hypothetical protein [Acetatifactor aquisgranensis]